MTRRQAQADLSDFLKPQTALPNHKWGCQDCAHRRGPLQKIGDKTKVRCLVTLRDAREGCPSWSDDTNEDLHALIRFGKIKEELDKNANG